MQAYYRCLSISYKAESEVTLHTGPDSLSCWAPSPNDPAVDDNTDDWLDRTMGFAVFLMNSTILWIGRLGLPHHPDEQISCLGWFTAQDLICSAYHQAGDEYDPSAIDIPCSQKAQHTDEWLKLIQAVKNGFSDPNKVQIDQD